MMHKISYTLAALALSVALDGGVQADGNSSGKAASDMHVVPAGTVITPASAAIIAQDAYLWGWPLVNAFNRRASFASAPRPGLVGGILPTAPTGYVAMLSDYISPDQRWVAHPNQDGVYGFGYAAVDDDPVVLQVPDFGDRFWVYALYDARSEEFSQVGKQYGTKPGNYLVVGPNWKGAVPEGITEVIKAPTELVAMGPRVFMDDSSEDRAAVQKVLNGMSIYPLSTYDGKTKSMNWKDLPHFPAPQKTDKETSWVNPEKFFDQLSEVLAKVPPLAGEESRYAMLKALLEASKDPAIKQAMLKAAKDVEEQAISPLFSFRTNGSVLPNG
ncbi:MAG: DUF1254 domain-containing protein, partial [Pseudomonas sp.]